MYAVIKKNKLHISVAEFYDASWYDKNWSLSGKEKFEFEYGELEIDVHKNGKPMREFTAKVYLKYDLVNMMMTKSQIELKPEIIK